MTTSLTVKAAILGIVLGAGIIAAEILIPEQGSTMTTANAQQEGHGGATTHGGATSPHGSSGGAGSWGGADGDGQLGGGGRSGFGYWGGRHVPEGPAPGDASTLESGAGGSQGYGAEGVLYGNCDDISKEELGSYRLSGKNLVRLNVAGYYLAPDVTAEKIQKSGSPRRNIANYQEELEKAEPDVTVAGIYLGLVANIEVTPLVIKKVNAVLCVNTDEKQTRVISEIAEIQRKSMK